MVSSSEVSARLSRIAVGQWGLLTTGQAEREGLTRLQLTRLADAGVLVRVDRGVYALAAVDDMRQTLRAAWLALEPARTAEERLADPIVTGVVSHASAAGLHGLGDLLDDVPEFTLPTRKQSRRAVKLHRAKLTPAEVTIVGGLPTTTIERTIADLLRDGHDADHVAQIVGQAVRRDEADLDVLAHALGPLSRRHGHPDGRALLEALLDLVNLSPEAVVREVASTVVGRELFNAGIAAALQSFASSLPSVDVSGLAKGLNVASLAIRAPDISPELTEAMTGAVRAQLAGLNSPAMNAIMEQHQPALRAIAEAASNAMPVSNGQQHLAEALAQSPALSPSSETGR